MENYPYLCVSSLKYGSFGTGIFPRSDWIVIYFIIH